MVDLLMQSASLGREGSSHSGSAFSASRALVGEHTPTEEERVKQLYASFPKLELVLLAQCAAMADMMGEELSPRYDTYKKERQQVLQRMAEQKAKEEEEACQRLSTEGGSEENEESSDDDDDVVVAARQKKKADTTQQKKKQSEMEVFLKNYRNESILEPFIERFRLRSDGKKENTTSDNAIKKEEEEEETSVLRMNLRRLELEGHLRVDLFNFCPWPLPHQLYNHK
ncbi:hypothetical protein AGDE_13227 [Angomonas deanei]|uniref:Uncharacterized protein n=1 Tax=Angomonas deanei TaxID=59799 RepID=A0A7G2CTB2_9TRYP|nr:hypothetical protein AGDE_13227 [Angomonas deanei]CAD2221462.1 hypothetical protein, conserved [Angomonas deanei]|eukprot:EPY22619.1 hypothetical protein AGDE_13227 [Angomonas deanei]